MSVDINTDVAKARQTFQDADDAWGDELRKAFGNMAGYVRYTSDGRGEPGSTLEMAYRRVCSTGAAWRAMVGMEPARGEGRGG